MISVNHARHVSFAGEQYLTRPQRQQLNAILTARRSGTWNSLRRTFRTAWPSRVLIGAHWTLGLSFYAHSRDFQRASGSLQLLPRRTAGRGAGAVGRGSRRWRRGRRSRPCLHRVQPRHVNSKLEAGQDWATSRPHEGGHVDEGGLKEMVGNGQQWTLQQRSRIFKGPDSCAKHEVAQDRPLGSQLHLPKEEVPGPPSGRFSPVPAERSL